MAPRGVTLLSLIASTHYPPFPFPDDLEGLKSSLEAQSSSTSTRLSTFASQRSARSRAASAAAAASASAKKVAAAASIAAEEEMRLRKKENLKKRKEREEAEEREKVALAANERAGVALEAVERRRFESVDSNVKVKRERKSASPAPSNASSASFRPPLPNTYGSGHKKKKLKRLNDSEDESTPTIPTPSPSSHATSGLKLKLPQNKSRGGSSTLHPPASEIQSPAPSTPASIAAAAIDWSLPPNPTRPLVPPRPGIQRPLSPGPKRQADVDEDFSEKKPGSQLAMATFWSNVDPYIRDIREDDLAMLGFKADTPESYSIPPRGRHYTEVWDEEDGLPPGSTPRVSVPNMRQTASSNGASGSRTLAHFVPSVEMREEDLIDDTRGLGKMTERLVAALIGGPDVADAVQEAAIDVPEPEGESSRDAAKVDVVDMERGVMKELRSVMLLGEHEDYDPTNRDDDEITSALRQCQRLLLQQTEINNSRKETLAQLARSRIAQSEYASMLEGIDKQIESSWAKRIKKHGSGGKRTLQNGVISGHGRPPVPESFKHLLRTREAWINTVGAPLKSVPGGEDLGIPTTSIYSGIGAVPGESGGEGGGGGEGSGSGSVGGGGEVGEDEGGQDVAMD